MISLSLDANKVAASLVTSSESAAAKSDREEDSATGPTGLWLHMCIVCHLYNQYLH